MTRQEILDMKKKAKKPNKKSFSTRLEVESIDYIEKSAEIVRKPLSQRLEIVAEIFYTDYLKGKK